MHIFNRLSAGFFYITILFALTYSQASSTQYKGKSINKPDENGRIAIHHATLKNDVQEVKSLLYNINCKYRTKDNKEKSFLHLAVAKDSLPIVQLAISKKPLMLSMLDINSQTPIFYTVNKPCSKVGKSHPNHARIFDLLLNNEETDPKKTCFEIYDAGQYNLIRYIIEKGHVNIFTLLVQHMIKNERFYKHFTEELSNDCYTDETLEDCYKQSCISKTYPDLSKEGLKKVLLKNVKQSLKMLTSDVFSNEKEQKECVGQVWTIVFSLLYGISHTNSSSFS